MTSNLSDCFDLLRSLKSSDYPKIMFFDQERLENPVDIANGFNKFFAKNFNTGSYTGVAYSSSEFISLKDFKFSIRPHLILIERMRIKLSTYPTNDYFPCQLLKMVPQMFADLLAYLFYSITGCKIFPALWKVAFIRPLHKSLSKASIENYRPISLLSKILIFERLLFVYLFGLCKAQLHPKQFGFQSRKNAVLQLIDYLETLYRNKSSTLFSVYLDYEKAFDKVPHKILLSKLKLFGFDSELLLLFETYLNGRTQVVNVNGYFSEHLSVPSGVPQGSVLGPFFFLIFINDLPSIFLDAMIWLFADDLKLLFSSLNFHNDLTRLYNWNLSNGMIANLGKTNCLNFRG